MQRLQKNLILSVLVLSLSGCGFIWKREKPIEVSTKPVERAALNLSVPPMEGLKAPKWRVITPSNANEVWADMAKAEENQVLFGLTAESYQDLAFTMAEIRNNIKSLRMVIEKYKEYYEPPKKEEKKN